MARLRRTGLIADWADQADKADLIGPIRPIRSPSRLSQGIDSLYMSRTQWPYLRH